MKLRRSFTRSAVVAAAIVLAAPAVFPEVAGASVGDAEREVQRIVDELERLHTQADVLAEDYAEAVDQKGQLVHDGGVLAAPGMYALGLPFGRRRKSVFLDGVGADARELTDHLAAHLDRVARASSPHR